MSNLILQSQAPADRAQDQAAAEQAADDKEFLDRMAVSNAQHQQYATHPVLPTEAIKKTKT